MRLFSLTKGQEKAKAEVLATCMNPSRSDSARFHLINGPSGSGKSTLIQDIMKSLPKDSKIGFTAPTHKAAKVLHRMAFKMGILNLVTIRTVQSALGLKLSRKGGEEKLIKPKFAKEMYFEYLFIDEGSMLDDGILGFILECKAKKVIFIADKAQIGPIVKAEEDEHGIVRVDGSIEAPVSSIFTEVENQSELTEIMRQAADSPIIRLATLFREAQLDLRIGFPSIVTDLDKNGNGVAVIPINDWIADMVKKFSSSEFKNDPDYCRVVCYTNGAVDEVNDFIRGNMHGWDVEEYVEGEIIVAQESGHGVDGYKNAEEFTVVSVNRMHDDEYALECIELVIKSNDDHRYHTIKTVVKESKTLYEQQIQKLADTANSLDKVSAKRYWTQFWAMKDKFKSFKYVYAMTAHKSQGSTFTHTYIYSSDFIKFGCNLGILRLLYTALTRSSLSTSFSLE